MSPPQPEAEAPTGSEAASGTGARRRRLGLATAALLLGIARQLVENLFAFPVYRLLVCNDVLHANTAVLANLPVGNGVFFQKLDQERPRDVQHFGGLHRGQFRAFGDDGYASPVGHGFQHSQKQLNCTRRKLDGFLLPVIPDAKRQRTLPPGVVGENLTGTTRDGGIPWRGRKLAVGCGVHRASMKNAPSRFPLN